MKKYLLPLLFLSTIISCTKDDTSLGNQKKDYSKFLNQTNPSFEGKLDERLIWWNFGYNQFQGMAGYENGNGICDSTDPVRVVFAGLTDDNGGNPNFVLYSPKYNSQSESDFSNVFSVGKKKLGDYRTDFHLSITWDNDSYRTNRYSESNEIEILKTQEFTDYLGKKIRVWFRIDTKLSTCSCQNNNSILSNGLIIAEFWGYKKE